MNNFEQQPSQESEPKKPFIVIDYSDKSVEPRVVFNGYATSEEEAREILGKEKIEIDFEKNPEIVIAFENE